MALTATQITLVAQTETSVALCAHPVGGILEDTATYQWYRSTTQGFTPGGGNILSGKTSRTLTDTGLTSNTIYYYVLRATSGMDTVDYPEFDVLTLGAAVGLPAVVDSSTFSGIANNTLAGEISAEDGWTITTSGTNRKVIVCLSQVVDSSLATVAYCGGVPMKPVHQGWDQYTLLVFELENAPLGENAVTMKWGHVAGSYTVTGLAVAFEDCSMIAQRGTVVATSGTGTTASATVDYESGGLAVGVIMSDVAAAEGSGLTNAANLTSGLNPRIATAEQSSLSWTIGSGGSDWVVIAFSLKPVGAAGPRPLPAVERFDARTLYYADLQADGVIAGWDDWQANANPGTAPVLAVRSEGGTYSFYYAGTKVLNDIAARHPSIQALCEEAATKLLYVYDQSYMDPAGYSIPAYFMFTDMPVSDYAQTSDAQNLIIVEELRDNATYYEDGNATLEGHTLSRENAYHVMAHINAEAMGITARTTKHNEVIANAKDHISQWFDTLAWSGQDQQFSPFVVGLTAEALIRHWYETQDEEVLPLLITACNYLWDDAWDSDTLGMLYQLNPDCVTETAGRSTSGSPVLNNLIARMYYWVGLMTSDQAQIDRADWLFAGAAFNGAYTTGKQFNQIHWFTLGDRGSLELRDEFYAPPVAVNRSGLLLRRG